MFLFLSMDNTIACVKSSGMDLPWLTYFKFSQAWAYFFETAGRVSWRDIVRHLLPVQHLESHWRRSQACKTVWCQTKRETIDEKKNPPTMSPRFHLFVGGGAQRRSLKRRTRTTGTATTTNNAPPSGAIKNTNTKKKEIQRNTKSAKTSAMTFVLSCTTLWLNKKLKLRYRNNFSKSHSQNPCQNKSHKQWPIFVK